MQKFSAPSSGHCLLRMIQYSARVHKAYTHSNLVDDSWKWRRGLPFLLNSWHSPHYDTLFKKQREPFLEIWNLLIFSKTVTILYLRGNFKHNSLRNSVVKGDYRDSSLFQRWIIGKWFISMLTHCQPSNVSIEIFFPNIWHWEREQGERIQAFPNMCKVNIIR